MSLSILQYFFDVNEFQIHYQTCHKVALEGTQIKMPEPGDTTKFTNHKNKIVRPFVVYADMECTLRANNDTKKICYHKPKTCAYRFVCTFDESRNFSKSFKGASCVKDMVLD